jgi:hypothetical protein
LSPLSRDRRLCGVLALIGVLIAIGVIFLPVEASLADDPLLRLQGFGRQAGAAPTTADCGSALSNLGTPSGGETLYEVARDRACHNASKRRAAIAFAAGLPLVVLGVAGLVRGEQEEPAISRRVPALEPEPAPEARVVPAGPGDATA